jgi:hypothetical protein
LPSHASRIVIRLSAHKTPRLVALGGQALDLVGGIA